MPEAVAIFFFAWFFVRCFLLNTRGIFSQKPKSDMQMSAAALKKNMLQTEPNQPSKPNKWDNGALQ